jgi:hypothetical protein
MVLCQQTFQIMLKIDMLYKNRYFYLITEAYHAINLSESNSS